MSDELTDAVFDTNLVGPWVLSCEVARKLIEQKQPGRIVNIASVAAFSITGAVATTLYSTTKSAVVRMTESHAMEWARNHINVNCIAPGAFSSEMMDGMLSRVEISHKAFHESGFATQRKWTAPCSFSCRPLQNA